MSIEETSTPSLQDIVSKHSAPDQDAPATEVVEEVAVEASEEVVEAPEPVVEETPQPPKRDPAAARFGALAKKERELRNQMSSFENKMKEFEARENAIKEREMRFQAARRPTEKLKELGFTYADITQDLLGNYKEPELDPMDEKLKPFKENWDKFEGVSEKLAKEVEQLKNQIALKEQKEVYSQVLSEIKSVLADTDKYELTNAMGQEGLDLIQEVVLEYYNENEILLDYSAASDIVEKYYEDQIMSKVAGTKKMKSRFAAPQEPAKPSKPSPATKEPSVPKTLTQAHSTGSKATPNVDEMSKEEALAYLSKKIIFKQD
jgi:hypothetical protein